MSDKGGSRASRGNLMKKVNEIVEALNYIGTVLREIRDILKNKSSIAIPAVNNEDYYDSDYDIDEDLIDKYSEKKEPDTTLKPGTYLFSREDKNGAKGYHNNNIAKRNYR